MLAFFPVLNPKVVQHGLEIVLHQQASITEIAGRFAPLFDAAVVEHLMLVIDDEGHDPETEAFLEQDQPPDTAVAVLKGMDSLKTDMEIQQVI